MKILHLILGLDHGGAERNLALLCSGLAQRGHEIHVAYFYDGAHRRTLEEGGALLHSLQPFNHRDPRSAWRLYRLCAEIKPVIIQTWLTQMDVWGGIVARMAGIPWILTEQSVPSDAKGLETRVLHWANRIREALAGGAAAIVSNSRRGDAFWSDRYPAKLTWIVPSGIRSDEIEAVSGPLPEEVLSSATGPFVLFVGRLAAEKNVENLVRALILVVQDSPLTGVLCGDGSLRNRLQDEILAAGLAGRIRLLGFVPKQTAWGLMKRARMFVSVSWFEGLPCAVLESIVCQCPLVVSDIPAHREFLDEQCAVFIKPDDPVSIAAGIRSVLADPAAAGDRARNAHSRAGQWSIPTFLSRFEDLYRQVLQCPKPDARAPNPGENQ